MAPSALYIHVPFCVHHCGYCDFTVLAGRDDLMPDWLSAIQNELLALPAATRLQTVFIGGGTPTHLPADHLDQLLSFIRQHFVISDDAELSVEANPDGFSQAVLDTLVRQGVNRLSLGVQSFDDQCLRVLERQHTASSAVATIRHAAAAIPNISVDLMFAVPNQSLSSWKDTLRVATSLPARHISTYGLTWEDGTQFVARERRGDLQRAEEVLERDMYLAAIAHLTDNGFEHYEVSNFAKPGHQSRHNRVYWAADEYFAAGPGASRYVGGTRSTNTRNVRRWIASWKAGEPCVDVEETLGSEERAREAIMLALRLRSGLNMRQFETRFAVSLQDLAGSALQDNIDRGWLEIENGHLRLTPDGLLLADHIITDFL